MTHSEIEQNMSEHYKLMADFFKHLSILSITFILLAVSLFSKFFDGSATVWPIKFSIICLFFASIFSVFSHLSYVDTFRVPHLLSGSMYHKLVRITAIPLLLFICGFGLLGLYLVFSLSGI